MSSTTAITVPPVPYKVLLTDSAGFISTTWAKWFRQMLERVGGAVAFSNLDLATIALVDVSALTAQVAVINGQITALQLVQVSLTTNITNLASGVDGLNQGVTL